MLFHLENNSAMMDFVDDRMDVIQQVTYELPDNLSDIP
jgi:hypothetical protein